MTITQQQKENFNVLQALNLLVSERYYLSKKMDLNEIANKGFQTILLDNCTYDFDLVMEDGLIKVEKQNLETDKSSFSWIFPNYVERQKKFQKSYLI